MEFLVLGPIEVRSAGSPIRVGGVKQRSILALLIANRGHVVSTDRIVEDIYGEDAARGARRSVQSLVSILRRELGDVISSASDGYVLDVPRESVDAGRFEDRVAAGLEVLEDDPTHAAAVLRDALGLWRGDPFPDVDGRAVFEPEIVRLTELRLTAIEARIEADLASGRHREVLGELEALAGEHPLRERLWGLWMLALYRVGRQAEALSAYQRLRTALGEGLGIEPSVEVEELEHKILLHDPELDLVSPVPHNLPAQLTSFVGRNLELIEIGDLLADTRLVTLTGTGGSGKTRLAVELARGVLDDYPDGVWFIDLRGVDSAGGVASLIASTLRVVTTGGRPVADQLVEALWSRRLVLVLDNCEHVLDGVAPFVERLIRRDGKVRVLATSREPLGVPGESMVLVCPFPVPEGESHVTLAASDAAALFNDRARSASPGFVLDEQVTSVFEICRAVDGLPLALELAAARLRVFSPRELAIRLDDQLGTLRTTLKAGDLRHATIETTIRWSWCLLDDVEQTLFARLSVFPGTWSSAAAEVICGFDPVDDARVMDLVGSLVDKSLVVIDGVAGVSTRYRLLEPLRQFAARQLGKQTTERLRTRLVDYWCVTLTGSFDPDSRFAWRDHERAKALEVDQANLTAAVEWALASGRFDDAIRIFASPFGDLLILQGSAFESAARWMDIALEHRETISLGVLLSALELACYMAEQARRLKTMLGYAESGIELARTRQERHWFELAAALAINRREGHSETAKAMIHRVVVEAENPGLLASALFVEALNDAPERAWTLTRQAMEVAPIESPCMWDECHTSFRIFDVAEDAGHYDVATRMAERALELSRRYGWTFFQARTASRLAYLYAVRGRLHEAGALIAEAVPVGRRIVGQSGSGAEALEWAASIARLQGELDDARRYIDEALDATEHRRYPWVGLSAAVGSALIARDSGDPGRAVEQLADAARRLEDLDNVDFVPWYRSLIYNARAGVELTRDEPEAALEHLRTGLEDPDKIHHLKMVAAVDLAAIAFAQQGRAALAARLKGAIDRERDDCGLVIQPPDAPLREAAMRHAESIYDGNWDAAVTEGREMTLDEAVELARVEASRVGEAQAGVGLEDY